MLSFPGQMAFLYIFSQDTYPKGVIPLGAIQMARVAKDNKFEVVTNHRTFVFRADNEGKPHPQGCHPVPLIDGVHNTGNPFFILLFVACNTLYTTTSILHEVRLA